MTIRSARKSKHLTQSELAKAIGRGHRTVVGWEAERTFPTAQDLKKMAKVLDCDIGDLFPDERGKPAA
jgi:transcriptional regulator with XRE-family HTH domain